MKSSSEIVDIPSTTHAKELIHQGIELFKKDCINEALSILNEALFMFDSNLQMNTNEVHPAIPVYIQGLQYRGMCRVLLEDTHNAISDFQKVIDLSEAFLTLSKPTLT